MTDKIEEVKKMNNWLLTDKEFKKAIDDADYSSVIDVGLPFPNMEAEIDIIKCKAACQAQIDKLRQLGFKSKEEIAEFGLSVNEAALEVGRQQERERIYKTIEQKLGFSFTSEEWQALKEAK